MIRTKEELKSYFETGDVPTEENFSDLIDTLVTETDFEEALKDVSSYQSITYQALFNLRVESSLVPGRFYRITDYETTTTQADTRSAGHPFDIIVLALSESELSEQAWAIQSERDTDGYFANSELSAWQIWYSLDNDTNRFAWAMMKGRYIGVTIDEFVMHARYAETKVINDVTYDLWLMPEPGMYIGTKMLEVGEYCDLIYVEDGNFVVGVENFARISDIKDVEDGKGVIYRMIDEFGNDCPYDFKNIQFYRQWDEAKQLWSTVSYGAGVPCYTFSSEGDSSTTEFTDMSLLANSLVYSNTIKAYSSMGVQMLNDNCFFGEGCDNNAFGNGCSSNTFGNNCESNTFGNDCSSNTFGNNCESNTFGNDCSSNTFGNDCDNNAFGNSCSSNTFGNNCSRNAFGNSCSSNTFGNSCSSNTFGNNCESNTFGNDCDNNAFGNSCSSNTFGNNCSRNAFGNSCSSNTFGNGCYNNAFGNGCSSNTFGNGCYNNAFGNGCSSNTFGNDCHWNSFGNACENIAFGTWCDSNSFGNSCGRIKFASDSSALTKYNYYQGNHFGDCCWHIVFAGAETASIYSIVSNYNFVPGLGGTYDNYLIIDAVRNRDYETKVAKNSSGELKIYCEADLIL